MRMKTTVYIDSDLLRAVKVAAARTGKREYAIFEEALRRYLGFELLRRVPPPTSEELDEDEALDLAYRELREARR
jgi:Arc/MetJ family transcription regulator